MNVSPQIEIDHSKCTVPFDCKKCLRLCSTAVFHVQVVKVEKYRETDKKEPDAYVLSAPYRDKCTGCNKCIEVCPVDAITITLPEEVKA